MTTSNNVFSHTDVLNEMLAHECPREVLDDDIRVFQIDGHCVTYTIKARLVSTYMDIKYEVLDFVIED